MSDQEYNFRMLWSNHRLVQNSIHVSFVFVTCVHVARCTVLCGPVSSSVMVDTCSDTRLAVSCQQLRTHSTTDTDIYLHTTARVRVLSRAVND